jgi:CheY-like chemotaxis protein
MNILLIEDNPTDLKLLSAVMQSSGHTVMEKGSAEQAIEAIKARKPEVILLDLKLPGVYGLELARRLKADPETRNIPVIAITASAEVFSEQAALAAGCDAYIVKPVNTRRLNDQLLSAAHKSGAQNKE